MTVTTLLASILTIASMAAAAWYLRRFPVHALSALGSAGVMLGVLVVPGFSRPAAAGLIIAIMVLVAAGTVAMRVHAHHPLGYAEKTSAAIPLVDGAFMSTAVLLMPHHLTASITTAAAATAAPAAPDVHGAGVAMSGSLMTWFDLVAWAACVAILVVPAIRGRSAQGMLNVWCSGGMIAAMAVMAL